MKAFKSTLVILFVLVNTCFSQPVNDNPCGAIILVPVDSTLFDEPCTDGNLYTVTGATVSPGLPAAGCTSVTPNDVWFYCTMPASGNIILTISDRNILLSVAAYTATACNGTFVLNQCNSGYGNSNANLILSGTAGSIYYIRVYPFLNTASNYSFRACAKNLGTQNPPPISPTGFVGINNPYPQGNLDINGDAVIRRNIFLKGNFTANGNSTLKGYLDIEDSLNSQGFTRLGGISNGTPAIKMKELSLQSSSSFNGQNAVDHGLNSSSILSVSVLLEWKPGYFAPPEYSPDPLLNYNHFITPTQIVIQNYTTACTYICNKPVKILITYKQ